MRSQKIGSIITCLRNWCNNHLGIVSALYTLVVSLVLFIIVGIFFYDGRFPTGTRTIVFYFYFWVTFYGFGSIMARKAIRDIDKMVEKEKKKAIEHQSVLALQAIARSKEKTIPLTEMIDAERVST